MEHTRGGVYTHSDVADLQAPQGAQLPDQSPEQAGLLLGELREQLLQKGPDLGETAARSHPNTWRGAGRSDGRGGTRNHFGNYKGEEGASPCGVRVTSNSSVTLVGDIISGCRTPLNFIPGP